MEESLSEVLLQFEQVVAFFVKFSLNCSEIRDGSSTNRLCFSIERLLQFGLNNKKTLWNFLENLSTSLPNSEGFLKEIRLFTKVPIGRVRVFIRLCLNRNTLENNISSLFFNEKVAVHFYDSFAPMLNTEIQPKLCSLFGQLDKINFHLIEYLREFERDKYYSEVNITLDKLQNENHVESIGEEEIESDEADKRAVIKWLPDHMASTCMICECPFSSFVRKHHCRYCGGIFCSECSRYRRPLSSFGSVRVCEACSWILPCEEGSLKTLSAIPRMNNSETVFGSHPPKWLPDESVTNCMNCATLFSFIVRRHHCRNCGRIFCASCSAHRLTLFSSNEKPERICDDCYHFLTNSLLKKFSSGTNTQTQSPPKRIRRRSSAKDLTSSAASFGKRTQTTLNLNASAKLLYEPPKNEFAFVKPTTPNNTTNDPIAIPIAQKNQSNSDTFFSASSLPSFPEFGARKVRWMKDNESSVCLLCSDSFSSTNRRHHCRFCGKLFCKKCSNNFMFLRVLGYKEPQRVCDVCYDFVLDPEKMKQFTEV